MTGVEQFLVRLVILIRTSFGQQVPGTREAYDLVCVLVVVGLGARRQTTVAFTTNCTSTQPDYSHDLVIGAAAPLLNGFGQFGRENEHVAKNPVDAGPQAATAYPSSNPILGPSSQWELSMEQRPKTESGVPIGGWILKSADAASVVADLKEFGLVFRFPLPHGPRIDQMEAGQPCFLYVAEPGNAKVKPGIWAVGEVVGPVTVGLVDDVDSSASDGAESPNGERLFAEVELIPLQTRITLGELNDHRVLVNSELIDRPRQENPVVLRPEEVRALEEWDFALVEPTQEQIARLDEVLDQDDAGLIFQLLGVDRSIGIVDDGEDGLLAVVAVDANDDATEIGRYAAFEDALESIAHHAQDIDFGDALPAGSAPDGNPMGLLKAEDGLLALYLVGESVELWETGDEANRLAVFANIDDAVAGLAEAVEEISTTD